MILIQFWTSLEHEAKVQLGSQLKNTKLAAIFNNLYSETMEDG